MTLCVLLNTHSLYYVSLSLYLYLSRLFACFCCHFTSVDIDGGFLALNRFEEPALAATDSTCCLLDSSFNSIDKRLTQSQIKTFETIFTFALKFPLRPVLTCSTNKRIYLLFIFDFKQMRSRLRFIAMALSLSHLTLSLSALLFAMYQQYFFPCHFIIFGKHFETECHL